MKPGRSINVLICPWRTFVSRAVLGFIAATAWAEPAEIPKEKNPPLAAWLSADGITGDWGGLRNELAGCGIGFLGSEKVELLLSRSTAAHSSMAPSAGPPLC